jgi:CRP-like cAMP-binding protein
MNLAIAPFRNHLLASLDKEGLHRFASSLHSVDLRSQEVLYRPDQRITDVYFPETCVITMLTVMEDGRTIESATVGREGASWISTSFRSPTMPCPTMVAVGGQAWRISAELVENEIKRNGEFHNTLSHYAHVLLIQSLRAGACNSLHSMEQRCSRWMLMTLDRVSLDSFVITQEFLANLLGVQRTGITGLVADFTNDGILETTRGLVRVVDRNKLEQRSCECYQIMKKQFASLVELT